MKKVIFYIGLILSAILLTISACKKSSPAPNGNTKGNAMFWINTNLGCGNITVTINGVSKLITAFYPNGAPACGAADAANFELDPGTYYWTASCTNQTWSGTAVVLTNDCIKTELTIAGGGGGGGGGGGTANGQAMFWIASDLGCGNINVTLNGVTKVISSYYNAALPTCGATGCATFDLAPGTYNYSASCSGLSWNSTITITSNNCNRLQLTNTGGGGGGGGGTTTGQALFWIASDLSCGNITVTCNGQTRTISSFYSSGAPACGASGCATFAFTPGTYSYSASCSNLTWSGTVTVTANGCFKTQLTGSGGGGGGGGGGGTTGQVSFWVNRDFGCGNITVNCNGQSKTITSFFSSGAPGTCGATGCANFAFSPGTYSFTASCSNRNWSGTITVTSNGCILFQLI